MTAALASGLLALTLLAGCGDDEDAYCSDLEDGQQRLADLTGTADPGADTLTETVSVLRGLRSSAPEGLKDEWDTVVFAYDNLVTAVTDAGIDPAKVSAKQRPEGVSADTWRRIQALATQLGSARVLEASQGIEDHAREVCDVDFDA